jgi:hypothetical protein
MLLRFGTLTVAAKVPILRRNPIVCLVAAAALGLPSIAFAQSTPEASPTPAASAAPAGGSADTGGFDASKLTPEQQAALRLAIIKISQNPVGNITVLPFQNNFNFGVGQFARYQYNLNVQPVIPIMLSPKWNLIARTIFPVISQPSAVPPQACTAVGCGSTFGIGDTQEQLFFAPRTQPGALIWGVGPVIQAPTGSPPLLSSGKWLGGIDAVALVMPGKWVLGALVTQAWSFMGPASRPAVSSFFVQPFINYNLKDGWALSTAPGITANWTATQNKWTVPLGAGIAKTFKAGDQLMSLSVFYYTYVARPVGAPQTQLRVVWALLWPLKRGIDIGELLKEAQ